ncbi:Rne/Rng family ribonuclease [Rhodobacteraceae bacterium]|nr:Rne/Rng family ribonuclease [Paracoccaceae bacterium]
MAKKMLIDATHAEETRIVVVDGNKVEEFDFETINKRQLAGNIYLAKVTRVEPSLQAAFVDYGGNRHGFLAFAEIHPDYYQIPMADRQALLEEEQALAKAEEEEEEKPARQARRRRRSPRKEGEAKAEQSADHDDVVRSEDIPGMGVADSDDTSDQDDSDAIDSSDDGAMDDDRSTGPSDARASEEGIESVADEDVTEEIQRPRKPRPRRFKIQEVIKVRQIMLVQVVKEERGNKGAALTTYLSLAGRYCVLMPNTARGGGISRKITNAADRKKLKEIAQELLVPQGAGLIIRTAGAQRTKTEIRRDYEYLMRLWEQIRALTMRSVAPAPIYEEGDLIKRSIRDLYSRDIDEVLVEGERGYRAAKDFMKMIMPSHAKNVKHYTEALPLYARYQVEGYLGGMFNPVVQLKSGGYIVIGVTEALVAIDVNSGRATKEGSIEDTATKTNLEAAEEIARQLRLRDLAGLIVIDFIDMDERKNNAAVEKKMKDNLKTDRARIQVGRISGFGLLEMSRQRLRPGMLESTTQPCAHCHGTGLIRSDDSLALQVLREIEEEATRKRARELLVRVPVAVANYLMNAKREHVALIEGRYGISIRVESDPALVSPDFSIEKFKTATRVVPDVVLDVVQASAQLMSDIDDADVAEDEPELDEPTEQSRPPEPDAEGDDQPKKKKRRRRRRKKTNGDEAQSNATEDNQSQDEDGEAAQSSEEATAESDEDTGRPARRRTRVRSNKSVPASSEAAPAVQTAEAGTDEAAPAAKPARARRSRSRKPAAAQSSAATETVEAATTSPEAIAPETTVPEAEPVPAAVTAPMPEAAPAATGNEGQTAPVSTPAKAEDQPAAIAPEQRTQAPVADVVADAAPTPAKPVSSDPTQTGAEAAAVASEAPAPVVSQPEAPEPEAPEPEAARPADLPATDAPQPSAQVEAVTAQAAPAVADTAPAKPKRRGWWNAG